MSLFLIILFLLISLAVVVLSADVLIDGASSVARKTGISEFIIGALIVGFGTSCPELVVSLTGALNGSSDIALGNVTGSNIFNSLLILGLTFLFFPIAITNDNKKHDIPWLIGLTAIFLIFLLTSYSISRIEGIILLLLFASYIFSLFKNNKENEESDNIKAYSTFKSILFIVSGLAGLVFGGKFFVNYAVELAHILGASDKFIAITILAVGTSLPELVTCITAAIKKKSQMALGDIIGSNIFNLIFIIGTASVITPLTVNLSTIDIIALLVSSFIFILAYGRNKFTYKQGIIFLICFIIYYTFLFLNEI